MHLTRIKGYVSSLKIKYKIMIFITIIIFVITTINLISLNVALNIYDEKIYTQSERLLNLASTSIENEIKKLEELSFNIATNKSLQSNLNGQLVVSDYDKFRRTSELYDSVLELIDTFRYVSAIQIFDLQGNTYSIGSHTLRRNAVINNSILKNVSIGRGSHIWVYPEEQSTMIVSGRQIRQMSNLTLKNLGFLFIYIDIDLLVQDLVSDNYQEDSLLILKDQNLVYPTDLNVSPEQLQEYTSAQIQKYDITKINGKRYFITNMKSNHTDWYYYNIIPFEEEFKSTTLIRRTVILLYVILFFSIVGLGYYFSKNISEPIERLMVKIKKVQNGDFSTEKLEDIDSHKKDEVGQLHHHFQKMVENTDRLISENYKSKIVIQETEYKALQAQINPHFLYNSLQSINWLAKSANQKEISVMVEALGTLLRNSINKEETVIKLEKEISIIESYIAIQKIRFGERLNFTMDVEEEAAQYSIPKLTIQPIVENAVNYGLENMVDVCHIKVTSKRTPNLLMISIEDNGPGMDNELLTKVQSGKVKTKGTGIGLINIKSRLKIFFGDNSSLQIQSSPNKGTKVTVYIPYKRGEENV